MLYVLRGDLAVLAEMQQRTFHMKMVVMEGENEENEDLEESNWLHVRENKGMTNQVKGSVISSEKWHVQDVWGRALSGFRASSLKCIRIIVLLVRKWRVTALAGTPGRMVTESGESGHPCPILHDLLTNVTSIKLIKKER